MKKEGNIAKEAEAIAAPAAAELGYYLWDTEYVKEGTEWILRFTIDSEQGIGIEDCEKMSHALDTVLDEADIISGPYRLEVSSPGIEREIKTDLHLSKCAGQKVQIRLYAPLEGVKSYIGILKSYDNESVTIQSDKEIKIPRKAIGKMNIYFEF